MERYAENDLPVAKPEPTMTMVKNSGRNQC
jgi:hypothetical protein